MSDAGLQDSTVSPATASDDLALNIKSTAASECFVAWPKTAFSGVWEFSRNSVTRDRATANRKYFCAVTRFRGIGPQLGDIDNDDAVVIISMIDFVNANRERPVQFVVRTKQNNYANVLGLSVSTYASTQFDVDVSVVVRV